MTFLLLFKLKNFQYSFPSILFCWPFYCKSSVSCYLTCFLLLKLIFSHENRLPAQDSVLFKSASSILLFLCKKRLNSLICISQVSLYMDKFAGVCQSALHDCKLTFLQIVCDHDLFVEMPGRDPSDRYVNELRLVSLSCL